jgi:hypothetical protein
MDRAKAQLELQQRVSELERAQLKAEQSGQNAASLADMQAKLQALKTEQVKLAGDVRGVGRAGGRSMSPALASMTYDPASPVTVTGAAVFKMEWTNPDAAVSVDPKDGSGKRYTFLMASPNQLLKQGMTRVSLKPGDEVTITGVLSTGGQTMPDGTIAASAATITRADGTKLFDRSTLPASSNTCNWVSASIPPPCPASNPASNPQ